MKHLTDEQLNARLDGELPAKAAEAAERHLAECAACRDRLAELVGANAALARSLTREPGEAYFATFAERVQARIAAGAPAPSREAAADAAPRRSWFASPRALAWAGAAAVLVVVGAFAIQFGMQQTAGGSRVAGKPSIVGADRLEQREAAPSSAETRAAEPAPAANAPAPSAAETPGAAAEARRERLNAGRDRTPADAGSGFASGTSDAVTPPPAPSEAARKDAGARQPLAAPQRVQELRTLPGGEQVPVQTRALPQAEKQKGFAVPPADASRPRKPMALPMTPQPKLTKSTTTQEQQVRGGVTGEPRPAPVASPVPQSSALAPATGTVGGAVRTEADEAATFRLCGTVANAQGRSLEGATVTVVETGRSVVSGAGGAFCVDAPSAGATLSVLALGQHAYRATVNATDAGAPYAVTLRPVETLGEREVNAARLKTEPPPVTEGKAITESESSAKRGVPGWGGTTKNLYDFSRTAKAAPDAAAARVASDEARLAKSPALWAKAGALWTDVAWAAKSDAEADEARFHAAEARMNAWRLAPTGANRAAALGVVRDFLAKAPAGARRDSVEAWRRELPVR